jgi:hypothetical protein
MTVINGEREMGYSMMEYSSCGVAENWRFCQQVRGAQRGDPSRPRTRGNTPGVATPFGLASEAALQGGDPVCVMRLRLVVRFAVMIVFV